MKGMKLKPAMKKGAAESHSFSVVFSLLNAFLEVVEGESIHRVISHPLKKPAVSMFVLLGFDDFFRRGSGIHRGLRLAPRTPAGPRVRDGVPAC
jgi:hypothetical protein